MTPRAPALLLLIALSSCSSSSTPDAAVDAPLDAVDVARDTAVDVAPDVTLDVSVDAQPFCDIPGLYTYGMDGGFTPVRETVQIGPGRQFTFTRTPLGGLDAGPCMCSCSAMIDYCATSDGGTVDTLHVIVAFNDADVRAAFADQTSTLYGRDTRPADGQVFVVTRGDGRHFEVGAECAGASGCRAIPAGLARLQTVLTNLTTQQLARPECAALGS
ncbi:MAG: hypothetical protein IPN17_31755 [Deltaproteobacteria bacterium]|nr:hypothetical protein [Deltaproteobacteria bacterium]